MLGRLGKGGLAAACALAAVAAQAAHAAGGAFSIAVVPDTQNMIDYKHQTASGFPIDASELFLGEMRWIAERAASRGGDVVFAAAVGDVWQHQSIAMDSQHATRGFKATPNPWFATELEVTPQTREVEMPIAHRGYEILANAGVPFGVAPGNHDYDAMWSDARYPPVTDQRQIDMTPKTLGMLHVGGLQNFERVFGATAALLRGQALVRRELRRWRQQRSDVLGGGLYLPSHRTRDVARGCGPRVGGVGDRRSSRRPYHRLDPRLPERERRRRANPIIDLPAVDPTHNSAEDLWRELISAHDQIFLVLCGHHHGVARRTDRNAAGHEVLQLLADYQDRGQAALDAGVPLVRENPSRSATVGCAC